MRSNLTIAVDNTIIFTLLLIYTKNLIKDIFTRFFIVGDTGLEPVTSCMSSKHSNHLS